VEFAHEFYNRNAPLERDTVLLVISQSGETADTLGALREAKRRGHRVLAICNVVGSTVARETDGGIYMHAGPEIGVASTKAFVSMLVILSLLGVHLGRMRMLSLHRALEILRGLEAIPKQIEALLRQSAALAKLAAKYGQARDFFFLSRGYNFPIALEGALKLKEISYIHAEAYPAGELKHGPLALVTEAMPVVTVAPNDALLEKLKSNIQEVRARGGQLYVFADADTKIVNDEGLHVIRMPEHYGLLSPILHVVPLQLLAYHTACARGTDVDKPRNLAKSVTVE
jgi:glucosamine--fructose-6-phosphate aminotransferase (isomerizing)